VQAAENEASQKRTEKRKKLDRKKASKPKLESTVKASPVLRKDFLSSSGRRPRKKRKVKEKRGKLTRGIREKEISDVMRRVVASMKLTPSR